MIGGIIVGAGQGGGSRVVVRAIGPSLADAGVQDALADPTLELHDGNGALIASNDNWKVSDLSGQSQEAEVRATMLAPSNDLESTIVTTLAPGNYTAVEQGKNSSVGVGLVEVYDLFAVIQRARGQFGAYPFLARKFDIERPAHPMQRGEQCKRSIAVVRHMITQAFVLGAGLGLRLRPLTEDLPKPLVPIFQKPLITFALDHLAAAGVKSFVVNTHHLPAVFERFFADGLYREHPVRLVHESVLLETGGGIKNAQPWLGTKPFMAYSGDVLTDLSLGPLIEEHVRSGNDVTLALRETGLASNVAFRDGRVIDIGNRYGHSGNYDYANVSVWTRRFSNVSHQATRSPLFRSSPNGSVRAAGSGASFTGRSLVESRVARRISRGASHDSAKKRGGRLTCGRPRGPSGSHRTRASIPARKSEAVRRSGPVVESVLARLSRTRSFGPVHKLPPAPD